MSDHRSDERIVVGGAANLARYGDSFDSAVRPLLAGARGARRPPQAARRGHHGELVTVRIGAEGPYQELSSTSVVAASYGP